MFEQEKIPWLNVPCYIQNISNLWEKALHLGKRKFFKKGSTFTLEPEITSFAYVQQGCACHMIINNELNRDEIRFFTGPGSLLRDSMVYAGYTAYHSAHKCLSDVILYQFNKELLHNQEFLQTYPDLLDNFLFSIAAKSLSYQFFSSILKFESNVRKVAYFLYGFYLLNRCRLSFTPPFSQFYLSALLGISKLTVNRIIASLKKEAIISNYTKTSMQILDINRLKALRN